jgi:hypothetical protein
LSLFDEIGGTLSSLKSRRRWERLSDGHVVVRDSRSKVLILMDTSLCMFDMRIVAIFLNPFRKGDSVVIHIMLFVFVKHAHQADKMIIVI